MSNINKLRLSEEIAEDLGHRFKAIRKFKKITQEELARRTGVSYGSIKRFEQTGNISFLSLIELAKELGEEEAFENLFKFRNSLFKNIDEVR